MHVSLLLLLYIAITHAPLILAIAQGQPPRTFWDEIASGLAMTAFAILLVEFVLSGRFRTISKRIGMDVTMRFHQLVARTALVFVVLHPFLYQTPFGGSLPWDTTRQLSLGLDMASLATGVIAFVALPGFVLMSIFRDQLPYRYETWRILHAVGAVVIAAAIAHHTLEAGRYSTDPILAGFWILLLTIAFASLVWTYVVAPLRQAGRPYEVTSVRKIAVKTWEVCVRPKQGEALDFEAGQFAWLNLGHSPFSVHENPFSISSAPGISLRSNSAGAPPSASGRSPSRTRPRSSRHSSTIRPSPVRSPISRWPRRSSSPPRTSRPGTWRRRRPGRARAAAPR